MSTLFVNACMREGSRTQRLAQAWLKGRYDDVRELDLGRREVQPLGEKSLATYHACVAAATYTDALFVFAHDFAKADEIVIAAPFWNYGIPAKLHAYLELVCSQGVTFDIDETGAYVSLCKAQRLTFVVTAGGCLPSMVDDHCFGYVRTLAREFWHIPQIVRMSADGLDAVGTDVEALLSNPRVETF